MLRETQDGTREIQGKLLRKMINQKKLQLYFFRFHMMAIILALYKRHLNYKEWLNWRRDWQKDGRMGGESWKNWRFRARRASDDTVHFLTCFTRTTAASHLPPLQTRLAVLLRTQICVYFHTAGLLLMLRPASCVALSAHTRIVANQVVLEPSFVKLTYLSIGWLSYSCDPESGSL